MSITKVLAVVSVSDIEASVEWYARLFGRPADARPMPSLADWHVTDSSWVQVHEEPERSGTALLNFAVDDLAATTAELAGRGIAVGEAVTTTKNAELGPVTDPDGNTITLIENPSV